jgi:hypothetical protein
MDVDKNVNKKILTLRVYSLKDSNQYDTIVSIHITNISSDIYCVYQFHQDYIINSSKRFYIQLYFFVSVILRRIVFVIIVGFEPTTFTLLGCLSTIDSI